MSTTRVTYRQQYRRCGKPTCSRCVAGNPGHGPYWYAYWWEEGRSRSRYLGTNAPVVLESAPAKVLDAETSRTDSSSTTALWVRTLGRFDVRRGETKIEPEQWRGRRAVALFKCLLSSPRYRLPREQLIELLWPEGESSAGATNLRTTTRLLRRILDAPGATESYLWTEGEFLVLAPAGHAIPPDDWLDAAAFARAANAALSGLDVAACRAALAWYEGEYLPDDAYESWAVQARQLLRTRYLELLQHVAALCATQGEFTEAETYLRLVLTVEPSHEEAAATLMGLLAASGRRHEALHVYQVLVTVLEEELNVNPAAEVTALRARLLAQEAMPVAAAVPPRQIQATRPTNLPGALTSFVGRVWEITAIAEALASARLVTLTGPGGCGKTRLALEVADRLVEGYPDGVWLVELAAMTNPSIVAHALRLTLGVSEESSRPVEDTLVDFLLPRRLLLVLDNCEHLIDACANMIAVLLRACPQLRVLATSREGLGVAGERNYLVPSLATPDPDHLPPLELLPTYEAVALFLQRARARRPELLLTEANVNAVVAICVRLDGLPLAIELAAARVGALSVEMIAARLDDRFRLLTGGPRTALPRQQTLRATLDWSYDLLTGPEQSLLRRLTPFAGGFMLDAAETVGLAPGEEGEEWIVVDLLASLMNKSLVRVEETAGGVTRYRLLETVRRYAAERLEAASEKTLFRNQHLNWCLGLAEEAEPLLHGAEQGRWLNRLEAEHDNLRAALGFAREQDKQEERLRLAGALARFWEMHGYLGEGRGWLEGAPAEGDHRFQTVRAKAMHGAGLLAFREGDHGRAASLYEEALALRRMVGDRPGIAASLSGLGSVAREQGAYDRAAALQGEALAVRRELGDRLGVAYSLHLLGMAVDSQGDYRRAAALVEESLALKRELGDIWSTANSLIYLGNVACHQGEYERAVPLFEEGLALKRALGDQRSIADALTGFANVALRQGDYARAGVLLKEGLNLSHEAGARAEVAQWLLAVAAVITKEGQLVRAARLGGAAEALRTVLGVQLPPAERSDLEQSAAAMRAAMGEEALAMTWAEGRTLSLEEAVSLAMEDQTSSQRGRESSRPSARAPLIL